MNAKRWLIAAGSLLLAAFVVAQTTQSSTSQSRSGNGQSSASASSSASSSGNRSASSSSNGGRSVNGFGLNSGSGLALSGKPTHAILYALGNVASPDARQVVFETHSGYLDNLQKKGKVLLYGPWRDLPGSMAIVMANSDEEALALAKNDPAVRNGSLTFEVRAWNVAMPEGGSSGSRGGGSNSGGGNGGSARGGA